MLLRTSPPRCLQSLRVLRALASHGTDEAPVAGLPQQHRMHFGSLKSSLHLEARQQHTAKETVEAGELAGGQECCGAQPDMPLQSGACTAASVLCCTVCCRDPLPPAPLPAAGPAAAVPAGGGSRLTHGPTIVSAWNSEGEVYRDPTAALKHCTSMVHTLGLSKRHREAAAGRRAISFAGALTTVHSGTDAGGLEDGKRPSSGSGSGSGSADDKV